MFNISYTGTTLTTAAIRSLYTHVTITHAEQFDNAFDRVTKIRLLATASEKCQICSQGSEQYVYSVMGCLMIALLQIYC